VEAEIAAAAAEADQLAAMLRPGSAAGSGGGQWARPEGGLRPEGRGRAGAGLGGGGGGSGGSGGGASLSELNVWPVARQPGSHAQAGSGGGLFFAPETTAAAAATNGRALPKGSGQAWVGGGTSG
jgi:hypothetical protein